MTETDNSAEERPVENRQKTRVRMSNDSRKTGGQSKKGSSAGRQWSNKQQWQQQVGGA